MFRDESHAKKSAQVLKVLGNPYRLQIIALLMKGEMNVTELNKSVKVSQPALSQHLSRLRREGLLEARREQRQIFYFLRCGHVPKLLAVATDMVDAQAGKKPGRSPRS